MNSAIPIQMSDADAQIECGRILDDRVRAMVDAMIQMGWPPKAVFGAFRDVVEMQRQAYAHDPDPADDPYSTTM